MNRLKRILKWAGIVAGAAITILLALNALFVWSTGTRLERRLVALRQAGDPVRLADLAREPITPERNAAVFLRRAADDLDAIQKELLACYPKRGYATGLVAPADQERLEKLFAAYPKVLPLLEQAADCPDYDPQLDGSLSTTRFGAVCMERSNKHRLVNRVLRTRCALLLSKGRAADALASVMLTLRLTRHWRREPLIVADLVTAVCELGAMEGVNEVLQIGPVSPSARQALDNELALHDTMDGYIWALRSERAYSLSSVRELPGSSFWLTRGFTNDLMSLLIDVYDGYLEKASRPFYVQTLSEKRAATGAHGTLNPYAALVKMLEPGVAAVREPAERTRALSRALRVSSALQARVAQGSDHVPELTELGLPTNATIDPYNGEPLHVKKLPEGWMVYSVGSNRVDDGGILDYRSDLGAGPVRRDESSHER